MIFTNLSSSLGEGIEYKANGSKHKELDENHITSQNMGYFYYPIPVFRL
jgi:hypothetical protein